MSKNDDDENEYNRDDDGVLLQFYDCDIVYVLKVCIGIIYIKIYIIYHFLHFYYVY